MHEFKEGQRVRIQERNKYFNRDYATVLKQWHNEKLAQGILDLRLDDGRVVSMSSSLLNPVVLVHDQVTPENSYQAELVMVNSEKLEGTLERTDHPGGPRYYAGMENIEYVQEES